MRDDPILVIIVCALMCFPLFVFLKACDSKADRPTEITEPKVVLYLMLIIFTVKQI